MKTTFQHIARDLIATAALFLACHAQAQPTFEPLYQFETGDYPQPYLALGTDGNYYGSTSRGGTYGHGTVFRLTPAGVLTTIQSFNDTYEKTPIAGVFAGGDGYYYGSTGQMVWTNDVTRFGTTQGYDGNFYGTTYAGGPTARGSAFKVTPAGVRTVLVDFGIAVGAFPFPELALGVDGNLYGTTSDWGANTLGTAFKFTPEGVLTVLHHFGTGYRDGPRPGSGLMRGNDGNFYGVYYVPFDGLNLEPAIYKMTPEGSITLVAALQGASYGGFSRLFQAGDGSFRGVAGDKIFRMSTTGVTTTEASFDRPNGTHPGGLVKGSDGNFYGTTRGKGANYGQGTVFQISAAGDLTTLASFDGSCAGMEEGLDGSFYGISLVSGQNGIVTERTFFRITPAGVFKSLRSLGSTTGNVLTRGNDGNFYGATYQGGATGQGTFFRLTPTGTLNTLASFGVAGSRYPYSKPICGRDGNFYGMTYSEGADGLGTFYKVTPAGVLTILASLSGIFTEPLVEGLDGNFYGRTSAGGTSGYGTIFRITPTGTLTTLASLDLSTGYDSSGGDPWGGLTRGGDGNFYGSTSRGGANDWGTIFKVTSAGALSSLYSFEGANEAAPVFGNDGNIYCTTVDKIYRLALSPGVFPEPEIVVEQPAGSDLESSEIKNFGNPVIGASTSVTFTIRNGGSAGLTGLAITIDGTDAADFSVSKSPVAPVSPGGVTNFTVKFMPATIGSKSAVLHIASNDADEARFDINLSGDARVPVPEIVVEQPVGSDFASGDIQSFGKIALGASISVPFSIRNAGSANLTGIGITIEGSNASDFKVTASPVASVMPGGVTSFTVKFTPTAIGTQTAVLHLASNDADEASFDINLSGSSYVAVPEIGIQQPAGTELKYGSARISFGKITLGKTAKSKKFIIKNTGQAKLTGLSISKNGRQAKNFTVGPLSNLSISPGGSATFKVAFKPTKKGRCAAAIHIMSNDSNESPFDIKLTGAGKQASTH